MLTKSDQSTTCQRVGGATLRDVSGLTMGQAGINAVFACSIVSSQAAVPGVHELSKAFLSTDCFIKHVTL